MTLIQFFFQSLKRPVLSDIAKPNSSIPHKRWTRKFHYICGDKIEEMFSLLKSHFQDDENPLGQISKLIENNHQMKIEDAEIKKATLLSSKRKCRNAETIISSPK
jgi:hypothetical protein